MEATVIQPSNDQATTALAIAYVIVKATQDQQRGTITANDYAALVHKTYHTLLDGQDRK